MRTDAKQRRSRIITAACELFRVRHHDSVTLEEIAENADVGIATLYRNFPDRHSLDMACAEHLFERVIALQEQAIADFEHRPRHTWHTLNVKMVSKGLGTLVPALAPESLRDLPSDIDQLRATTRRNTQTLITLGQRHSLVHPDITADTFIVGLISVSRPPLRALQDLNSHATPDLLGIFLSGVEHGAATLTGFEMATVEEHEHAPGPQP